MLDEKLRTLLAVAEYRTFTKAAEVLSLTQPAVSHHIRQLEQDLKCRLFLRDRGSCRPTPEGEIAIQYAKRLSAVYARMLTELSDAHKHLTRLRIGITHTAESNAVTEILAQYGALHSDVSITIITDTIKNLYEMLAYYDLDMAIVDGSRTNPNFNYLMLDTDYLVCVLSNNHPLAGRPAVTLEELKQQPMILRLPSSATRTLFEATLTSKNESIDNFNVTLEVDNIATIKDLIRKDMGISILPHSACLDELRKKKLIALPIENLSMVRETNLVYQKDFAHVELLKELVALYRAGNRA